MKAADLSLRRLWRPDGRWKKAGVLLLGLCDQRHQQQSFLDPIDRERSGALMATIDAINHKHGRTIVRSGTTGLSARWQPLAERCSNRYTTRWDELPIVR
jgi:DNA polymerase V